MKLFNVCLTLTIILLTAFIEGYSQTNSFDGVKFTFILTDISNETKKTNFGSVEEIIIRPRLENNSNEPFPLFTTEEYYQFKYSLTKTGERLPIAYRADRATVLSLREEERSGYGGNLLLDPLSPGDVSNLVTMELADRYENLPAGHYRLMIEYKSGKFITIEGRTGRLRLRDEVEFNIGLD